MYVLLAVSFEMNKRSEANVKSALGWAGWLARKQKDPFTLIEVADMLLVRNLFEIPLPNGDPPVRLAELLDLAREKAPERPEPILMSLLAAERAHDPERMAKAVEQLMSLGWPGVDEIWRVEARRKVEALAKYLEEEGRGDEARTLLDRLTKAEGRDLFVRLTWKGDAGLDLVVEEPLGAKATVLQPRTVFGGAIIKSGRGKHPESLYVCPRAFDGAYKIRVEVLYNDEKAPVTEARLEVISHEGTPEEQTETKVVQIPQKEPVVVQLTGGRRTEVLPFRAPTRLVAVPEAKRSSTSTDFPTTSPAANPADALRAPNPPATRAPIRADSPPASATTPKSNRRTYP